MIGLTFSVKYYNKETKKGGLFSPLKKNIHLGGECVVDVAFGWQKNLKKSTWSTVHRKIEKYLEKGNIVFNAVIKMNHYIIIIITITKRKKRKWYIIEESTSIPTLHMEGMTLQQQG